MISEYLIILCVVTFSFYMSYCFFVKWPKDFQKIEDKREKIRRRVHREATTLCGKLREVDDEIIDRG